MRVLPGHLPRNATTHMGPHQLAMEKMPPQTYPHTNLMEAVLQARLPLPGCVKLTRSAITKGISFWQILFVFWLNVDGSCLYTNIYFWTLLCCNQIHRIAASFKGSDGTQDVAQLLGVLCSLHEAHPQQMEPGGSEVQSQPWSNSKFKTTLGYARFYLKNKQIMKGIGRLSFLLFSFQNCFSSSSGPTGFQLLTWGRLTTVPHPLTPFTSSPAVQWLLLCPRSLIF